MRPRNSEHSSFILMRVKDTFDGQDRVPRAAYDLHIRATSHSASRRWSGGGLPPPARVVVPNSGKIDYLILCTSERSPHPVDFNDRTEMLRKAFRWIPTHACVVDLHDPVRMQVELLLKGVRHVCSLSIVLITILESAVNGEDSPQCH